MTGEKVKNVIIAKGYSVAQVAEMIGTSQQNLASGLKHTDVRSGLLEKIAAALSIPVLEFYGEDAPSGFTVRVQGSGNTAVSGNANTVNGVDKTLLDLLCKKEEQLTLTIKQVSKAQEQMDKVLERLDGKNAVHVSEN